LLDDYGAGVAAAWNNNLMAMFSSNNSLEDKKPALAAMLAYGQDLYHSIYDPAPGYVRYWDTGATQHPGKFLPAVFFAALANSTVYADQLKTASERLRDSTKMGPLELAQVHTGTNGYLWGDEPGLTGIYFQGSYWANLFASQCYEGAAGTCNPSLGSKTMFDPYGFIDGPPNKPGTAYIGSSLGVQKSMVAAMLLMPRLREIVNYEPLIMYVDRILNYGLKTANDPCVTPDSREDPAVCDAYRNKNCTYYGVTWGPVTVTDMASACITTPTSPYTQAGRFTSLDGTKIGTVYTSSMVEANWDAIWALYNGRPGAPSSLIVQ